MKLEDLERLRPEIESWLRADGVPAEEVPDLAKAVIHRAWNNRGAYDPTKPLEPWLRTMTKRIAIDYHRTMTARAALAFRLLEDERDNWNPERQCIHAELLRSLSDAIATLDEESRALIEAHYTEGRTLPEMSEDLGVPESTLNKRLIRARRAIRDYLEGRGITDAHRAVLPLALFRALYTYTHQSDGTSGGEGSADSPIGPQAERSPALPPAAEPGESTTPGAEYGSLVNEEPRESTTPGAEYGSLVNEEPPALPAHVLDKEPSGRRTLPARPGRRWWAPDRPALLVGGVLIGLLLRASTCTSAQDADLEVTVRAGGPVRLASLRAGCGIAAPAPTPPPPTPSAAPLAAAPRPASRPSTPEPTATDRESAQELLSGTVEPISEPVSDPAPPRTP
jgi:RNA polymerase sigma-70 factor (ECF subfamily)